MGLENAQFISELVVTNPLGTDPKAQGDDHLRVIKQAVQQSFPNVDASVDATPTELNRFVGSTGVVVQMVNIQDGSRITGTNLMPAGNFIPDNTDGFELFELAITPKFATSQLKIDVVLNAEHTATNSYLIAAVYKDTDVPAIFTAFGRQPNSTNNPQQFSGTFFLPAGSTDLQTFKVRGGGGTAGTCSFNSQGGGLAQGGINYSSITITEIAQ